jgi:hypothetical protein
MFRRGGGILEFRVQRGNLVSRQRFGLYVAMRSTKAPQRDLVSFGRLRFASFADVLRGECIDKAGDRERCPLVRFFRLRVLAPSRIRAKAPSAAFLACSAVMAPCLPGASE